MTQELEAGQGRQVQRMRQLQAQGLVMGGWKLGQTSGGSRDAFGPGYRAFGYVRQDRIFKSGATLVGRQISPWGIETEACFILQQDLIGEVDAAQARAAVWVAPAFELNQTRLGSDAPVPDRIADNLSNWGICVGTAVPVPRDWQPHELVVAMGQRTKDHGDVERNSVAAANHIDDHFESLALLANRLQQFGEQLKTGEHVITGAYGRVREPSVGTWYGDFDVLGQVEVCISD